MDAAASGRLKHLHNIERFADDAQRRGQAVVLLYGEILMLQKIKACRQDYLPIPVSKSDRRFLKNLH